MSNDVFILDQSNSLLELNKASFETEDVFQAILARHPALMRSVAGADGRLLLVRREAPVPDSLESKSGRWSLDHLFLNSDGVPVLVEVKRATDTRNRREVVAQMLDYAANSVAYWPIENLIAQFQNSVNEHQSPEERLADFLGGADVQPFWERVDANLRAGRIRMVFVADVIPPELQRIVEFLNEQMRPAEVLALQIEQFAAPNGTRLLTPRMIGNTLRAADIKTLGGESRPKLSFEEWIEALAQAKGSETARFANKISDWAAANGFHVVVTNANAAIQFDLPLPNGKLAYPFFVRNTGRLEVALKYLADTRAFKDEQRRRELMATLTSIPGMILNQQITTGWAMLPLERLSDEKIWSAWTQIALSIKEEVLAADASQT